MENLKIKKWILVSFLIFFILYGIFESYKLISGPSLRIESPIDGSYFEDNLITVKGYAKNISFLKLNDRPIFINKEGYFEEKLILVPGYNIMILKAEDRFGKISEKKMQFFLKKPEKNIENSIDEFILETRSATSSKKSTSSKEIIN